MKSEGEIEYRMAVIEYTLKNLLERGLNSRNNYNYRRLLKELKVLRWVNS